MDMYFGSFKKNTANENSSIRRNKQIRLMLISSCAISGQFHFKINKQADYLAS